MMNRIVLIGNGFDLAHGLPTSYTDFIRGYQIILRRRLLEEKDAITDGLCSVKIDNLDDRKKLEHFSWILDNPMFQFHSGWTQDQQIRDYNSFFENLSLIYDSRFFEAVNKSVESKNWVDIEGEYYSWLKRIFKHDESEYTSPIQLNDDLELIKGCLLGYLLFIQKNQIKPELVKDCIRKTIYEPFCAKDISNEGNESFRQFLIERLEYLKKASNPEIDCFLNQFGQSFLSEHSNIDTHKDTIKNPTESDAFDIQKHIRMVDDHQEAVPDCFLFPDQILFLNFNYTNTADLYISKNSGFTVNHIHGELENEKNPIIFGYGDELDDDYKEISKLNDNSYLTNIKSIRYLETDNYRRLLRFIDSAPYQIYIMGHSCGNSDRTLLNTLFEHKNCLSIKPFYHEKLVDEGTVTDNYIEIIQNISRNFNSMQKMRDRVVNKSYCRPLVPLAEQ